MSCTLFNGTSGVMIGGQCMAGIEIPTTWSVVCLGQETASPACLFCLLKR